MSAVDVTHAEQLPIFEWTTIEHHRIKPQDACVGGLQDWHGSQDDLVGGLLNCCHMLKKPLPRAAVGRSYICQGAIVHREVPTQVLHSIQHLDFTALDIAETSSDGSVDESRSRPQIPAGGAPCLARPCAIPCVVRLIFFASIAAKLSIDFCEALTSRGATIKNGRSVGSHLS